MYDPKNDWCVYYQKSCDAVTDPELDHCADHGLACHKCPQRLGGVL